jgi:hypothetical protein
VALTPPARAPAGQGQPAGLHLLQPEGKQQPLAKQTTIDPKDFSRANEKKTLLLYARELAIN